MAIARIVLPVLVLALGASGCLGPRTQVRVPDCVERVEVTGQHHRVDRQTFLFDHGLELPFTETQVTVESPDGSTETFTYVNSNPDWLRVAGAAVLGAIAAGSITYYGYFVGSGTEPTDIAVIWALPIFVGTSAMAVGLAVTGWHPPANIDVPARCADQL